MSESVMNGSSVNDGINNGGKPPTSVPPSPNPNYPPAFRPLAPLQNQAPRPVGDQLGNRPPPPRLQRIDSRGSFPPRGPPSPNSPNQPFQHFPQRPPSANVLQVRTPQAALQLRPQGPPVNYRPPAPGPVPQNLNQQAPRPTGNVAIRPQSNQPPPGGNFKRFVNAVQSAQLATTPEDGILDTNNTLQQRSSQPGPRPPGIFPQRTLSSGPPSLPPDVQNTAVPSQLVRQQSFSRKPSQEGLISPKMESDKPQEIYDDSTHGIAAKNRSYSISVPTVPDLTKPMTEEERRRSVSAIGSTLPGTDHKIPSSLAFIQERMASGEKTVSQSSLDRGSRESLPQATKDSPVSSRPQSVARNLDDDDNDVVVRSGIPPKSNTTSKSPSPLPRNPDQNVDQSKANQPDYYRSSVTPERSTPPKGSINGSHEDIPRVVSRPPSGFVRDSPRAVNQSQEDLYNSRPQSMTASPQNISREDITKVTSRPPSGLGRETPRASSREDVRKISRPPSSIEKEPPAVTNLNTEDQTRSSSVHVSEGIAKDLVVEAQRSAKVSDSFDKRPTTLETKKPDNLINNEKNNVRDEPPMKKTPGSDNGRHSASSVRSRSRTGREENGRDTKNRIRTTSARSAREGDNDSGVDEGQGNECNNGDLSSPKKGSRIPGLHKPASSPTKSTPSKSRPPRTPKTPDPLTTPDTPLIKKVPMNKIQVGAAPSPNLKTVRSKIGSLGNASHKPGGGHVKIENRKLDFANVQPRIAAKNDTYQPGGGDKKIQQVKLKWEAKPKVGSLDNATHKPGGGDKKIESVKLDFKDKAKPKVASKDNIQHKPAGGDVKSPKEGSTQEIEQKKLEFRVQSKVGSLDNVKYKPGGGDKKIFDDKDYLKQVSADKNVTLSGHQSPIPSESGSSHGGSRQLISDENLNRES